MNVMESNKRVVKFRAMKGDMSNPNWLYGNLIYSGTGQPRIQSGNTFSFATCLKGTEGQFTGLTDKNGVEIYEGDIVRMIEKYSEGQPEQTGEIIYHDFTYALATEGRLLKFKFTGTYRFGSVPDMELEVIGNIYQNPELLK